MRYTWWTRLVRKGLHWMVEKLSFFWTLVVKNFSKISRICLKNDWKCMEKKIIVFKALLQLYSYCLTNKKKGVCVKNLQVTELKSATPLINIMFSNRWRFSEIITNLSRAIIKREYQTKMRYKYSSFEIRHIATKKQKKKN